MSSQSSATLITYFQTGSIPTEDNFSTLIDSCLNLVDTGITVTAAGQITLQSITTSKADGGPMLSLSDSSSTVNMQWTNGTLNISSGVNANALTVTGQVSADSFTGSGTGLNDIPVSALTGILNATQLPAISASNVTGILNIDQIPPIPTGQITGEFNTAQLPVFSNMIFYSASPLISSGTTISLCWQTDYSYNLTLSFIKNGSITSYSTPLQLPIGTGNLTITVSESTLFTLTAMKNNAIVAQQQLWVNTY